MNVALLLAVAVQRLLGQLALPRLPLATTRLDGGVLQGGGTQRYPITSRHQEMQHVSVVQSLKNFNQTLIKITPIHAKLGQN